MLWDFRLSPRNR